MGVGMRIPDHVLTDQCVVVDEQARRLGRKLERDAARYVIKNIADEIDRSAEDRLCTDTVLSCIHSPVPHHSYIMNTPVRFYKIIHAQMNIIIQNVNRHCL